MASYLKDKMHLRIEEIKVELSYLGSRMPLKRRMALREEKTKLIMQLRNLNKNE